MQQSALPVPLASGSRSFGHRNGLFYRHHAVTGLGSSSAQRSGASAALRTSLWDGVRGVPSSRSVFPPLSCLAPLGPVALLKGPPSPSAQTLSRYAWQRLLAGGGGPAPGPRRRAVPVLGACLLAGAACLIAPARRRACAARPSLLVCREESASDPAARGRRALPLHVVWRACEGLVGMVPGI